MREPACIVLHLWLRHILLCVRVEVQHLRIFYGYRGERQWSDARRLRHLIEQEGCMMKWRTSELYEELLTMGLGCSFVTPPPHRGEAIELTFLLAASCGTHEGLWYGRSHVTYGVRQSSLPNTLQ
jgi:hypothetical protein